MLLIIQRTRTKICFVRTVTHWCPAAPTWYYYYNNITWLFSFAWEWLYDAKDWVLQLNFSFKAQQPCREKKKENGSIKFEAQVQLAHIWFNAYDYIIYIYQMDTRRWSCNGPRRAAPVLLPVLLPALSRLATTFANNKSGAAWVWRTIWRWLFGIVCKWGCNIGRRTAWVRCYV